MYCVQDSACTYRDRVRMKERQARCKQTGETDRQTDTHTHRDTHIQTKNEGESSEAYLEPPHDVPQPQPERVPTCKSGGWGGEGVLTWQHHRNLGSFMMVYSINFLE